jgi:beta-glucosidase
LFGDYCPGGKLTISFPRNVGQIPVFYYHKKSGGRSHWRGDYVETSAKPLYPFGFGKSYTKFEYENFLISKSEVAIDESIDISISIRNIGTFKGDEIVQLYINDKEASVTRPVMELKGFKRISLSPGETKRLTFTLAVKQLCFYDMSMNCVVEPGDISVMIGSSSEDIRSCGGFKITGEITEVGNTKTFFSSVKVKNQVPSAS